MPPRYRIRNPRLMVLLIGSGALLGSSGAALAAWREPDVFRTSITLQVLPGPGGGDPLIDQAKTYVTLADTGPTVEKALLRSGVRSGFSGLLAATDGLTPFVNVDVTGTDPVAIARVADVLADVLPEVAVQLEQASPSTATRLRALSPAVVPRGPESIGLDRAAARGLFAGTLVGLGAAVAASGARRHRPEEQQFEEATGSAVLSSVPQDDGGALPTRTDPQGARSEAYHLIRSLLQAEAGPAVSLLITSSSAGEGKTALVANLAVSLSQAGERVLVVDADVLNPQLHARLGAQPGPGLLDVLAGRVPLEQAMQRAPAGSVTVLATGTADRDPTELLASDATAVLLRRLADSFDRVLIDAPSVSRSSVATGLARRVGGVLLVIDRTTTTDDVTVAQRRLTLAGAHTLGLVLTSTKRRGSARRAEQEVPRTTTGDRPPSVISWQSSSGEGR